MARRKSYRGLGAQKPQRRTVGLRSPGLTYPTGPGGDRGYYDREDYPGCYYPPGPYADCDSNGRVPPNGGQVPPDFRIPPNGGQVPPDRVPPGNGDDVYGTFAVPTNGGGRVPPPDSAPPRPQRPAGASVLNGWYRDRSNGMGVQVTNGWLTARGIGLTTKHSARKYRRLKGRGLTLTARKHGALGYG